MKKNIHPSKKNLLREVNPKKIHIQKFKKSPKKISLKKIKKFHQ